jgi:hypothetical protein
MIILMSPEDNWMVAYAQTLAHTHYPNQADSLAHFKDNCFDALIRSGKKNQHITFVGHALTNNYGGKNLTPAQFIQWLETNRFPFDAVSTIDFFGCEIGLLYKDPANPAKLTSYAHILEQYVRKKNPLVKINAFTNLVTDIELANMFVSYRPAFPTSAMEGINKNNYASFLQEFNAEITNLLPHRNSLNTLTELTNVMKKFSDNIFSINSITKKYNSDMALDKAYETYEKIVNILKDEKVPVDINADLQELEAAFQAALTYVESIKDDIDDDDIDIEAAKQQLAITAIINKIQNKLLALTNKDTATITSLRNHFTDKFSDSIYPEQNVREALAINPNFSITENTLKLANTLDKNHLFIWSTINNIITELSLDGSNPLNQSKIEKLIAIRTEVETTTNKLPDIISKLIAIAEIKKPSLLNKLKLMVNPQANYDIKHNNFNKNKTLFLLEDAIEKDYTLECQRLIASLKAAGNENLLLQPITTGLTPLMLALYLSNENTLKVVAQAYTAAGLDVAKEIQRGTPPHMKTMAHIAIEEDTLHLIPFIKKYGGAAALKQADKYGFTPIMLAILNNKVDFLSEFKPEEIKAELGLPLIRSANDKDSLAHRAALSNNTDALELIHHYEPKLLNQPNSRNYTPAYEAASSGNLSAFTKLAELKVNMNEPSQHLPAVAVVNSAIKNDIKPNQVRAFITALVEAKADFTKKDSSGKSALDEALNSRRWDIVLPMLISMRIDDKLKSNYIQADASKMSPIGQAAKEKRWDVVMHMLLAIDEQASSKIQDSDFDIIFKNRAALLPWLKAYIESLPDMQQKTQVLDATNKKNNMLGQMFMMPSLPGDAKFFKQAVFSGQEQIDKLYSEYKIENAPRIK